jgi:hypothetical protein
VLTASPSSSPTGSPGPFELVAGTSAQSSQKVTFTNTGGASTSALVVSLAKSPSSAAFVITQNLCAGVALGPKKTCTVTISLPGSAPSSPETATLTVMSKKPLASAMAYFAANTPPVANNDFFSVTEASGQTYPLTDTTGNVLSNDADADGDSLTVASLDGNVLSGGHYTETLADGNSLTLNSNGTFTYRINNPINGSDVFHYAISDGVYSSNSASITFNVTDTAPVAKNDTSSGYANTAQTGNVLSNDVAGGGATLVVGSVNGFFLGVGGSITAITADGSVTVHSDGSFVYTPAPNFVGSDSFTYWVTDGLLGSNTATVTLQVIDPPIVVTPMPLQSAHTGQPFTFNVSPFFSGGIAPFSFTALLGLPSGFSIDSSTGVVSGVTNAPPGIYDVIVQVTDFYGQSVVETLSISVVPGPLQISTTQQPASATVGDKVGDQATISGGSSPSGTITFYLFAPGVTPNATNSNNVYSDTVTIAGAGTYTTASGTNPGGYASASVGTYQWVAQYSGDGTNSAAPSSFGDEPVTVTKATPTLGLQHDDASDVVGGFINDTAIVSGGFNPGGSTTFKLYDNPNGTGTPLFTSTIPSAGGDSDHYRTAAAGTFYWIVTYNGDSNNNSVTRSESVTITPETPRIITTQLPASATVGVPIGDSAGLSGEVGSTGSATFRLYDNATASGTPLFTDTETLVSSGAISKLYTPTATGTDYWVVTYSGDSNNNSVTSGPAAEPVTITPATPAISTTQLPPSASVGVPIADMAVLTGGFNPTGTVTFNLYNNPNATGPPLFTDTEPLGGGVATSVAYTPTATGTDYWVATYNGDGNNNSVTSGFAAEPVTITAAGP